MPISPTAPRGTTAGVRLVEDDDRVGRERDADRDAAVGLDVRPRRGHGGLGRAVDVEERASVAVPARDEVVRARLARDEQEAQARQVFVDRGEQRRHAAQCRHALLDEVAPQVAADEARPRRARHERGARRRAAPRSPRPRSRTRSSCPGRRDRRAAGRRPRAATRTKLQMPAWSIATPFGLPVEPEV